MHACLSREDRKEAEKEGSFTQRRFTDDSGANQRATSISSSSCKCRFSSYICSLLRSSMASSSRRGSSKTLGCATRNLATAVLASTRNKMRCSACVVVFAIALLQSLLLPLLLSPPLSWRHSPGCGSELRHLGHSLVQAKSLDMFPSSEIVSFVRNATSSVRASLQFLLQWT